MVSTFKQEGAFWEMELIKKHQQTKQNKVHLSLEITAEKRISPLGVFSVCCGAASPPCRSCDLIKNSPIRCRHEVFFFPTVSSKITNDFWTNMDERTGFKAPQQPLRRHGGETGISRATGASPPSSSESSSCSWIQSTWHLALSQTQLLCCKYWQWMLKLQQPASTRVTGPVKTQSRRGTWRQWSSLHLPFHQITKITGLSTYRRKH